MDNQFNTPNQPFENMDTMNAKPEAPVKTKKWPIVLGTVLGAVFGILLTCFVGIFFIVGRTGLLGSSDSTDVISALANGDANGEGAQKLSTLISLIQQYYYKDVDNDTLVDGIYSGLVESLDDPYSAYYNAEDYKSLMTDLTGNYAGIGALLQKDANTGEVSITKVYANTPAEKAGLLAGDKIVKAGDVEATSLQLDEFVQNIRGEEGTEVELTITRDTDTFTVTCTRANIATPTVEHEMLNDTVGYIAVSQFTDSTYDDFVAAYEDLESQGMTSVVFDMRNNGGGLLDSVVDILDYLLPEGTVVYTKDKYGNEQDYTSSNDEYKSIPMTVLVNGYTASAAEIFTGAIRDFDYGTIIGTQTFGKGIVQSTIPLTDGSALKITTQTYYTPSGECIHGTGITPDEVLEYQFLGQEGDTYSKDLDNQIQKAIEVLSAE
ncbi:MAG: S41 family peptidase [Pseudobutyrivibrio sp.]|nr:S41 family peptidase [Pseudobutyrivibrio sp.]